MNIHEYQAKSLLERFGVAVPRGSVAFTVDEATNAARQLGGSVWVVKSQIHAGGRGAGKFKEDPDGGGVRLAKSIEDIKDIADAMLGATLVITAVVDLLAGRIPLAGEVLHLPEVVSVVAVASLAGAFDRTIRSRRRGAARRGSRVAPVPSRRD